MAKPNQQKQQAADPWAQVVGAAQAGIDSAPTGGSRGTYLKLPANLEYFKPERGKTYKLVILAWTAGKYHPGRNPGELATVRHFQVHSGVGANGDKYICMQALKGDPCYQCEMFQRLRQDRNRPWDSIKDMKPKTRDLYLVHDLEGKPGNLQVWEESYHLFGKDFENMLSRKEAFKFFAHPEKGSFIEVRGEEKKVGSNSCTEFANPIFSPFGVHGNPAAPARALYEKAMKICLDTAIVEVPYEKLKRLLNSGIAADDQSQDSNEGRVDGDDVTTTSGDESFTDEATIEDDPPPPEDEPAAVEEEPTIEEEPAIVEEDEITIEDEGPSFKPADSVTLMISGKKAKGIIIKIDDDKASVKVKDKTYKVGLDKLTPA